MACHHVTPCAHVMSSYHVIIPCHVIMSCHHVTPCGHVMPSCHVITPCHVVMSSCHVPSCVCPRVVYVYDHMARQLQVNTEPVYVSVCFDQACLCLCVFALASQVALCLWLGKSTKKTQQYINTFKNLAFRWQGPFCYAFASVLCQ